MAVWLENTLLICSCQAVYILLYLNPINYGVEELGFEITTVSIWSCLYATRPATTAQGQVSIFKTLAQIKNNNLKMLASKFKGPTNKTPRS